MLAVAMWRQGCRVAERRCVLNRFCIAFADGQGTAFEVCEPVDTSGKDALATWFRLMRKTIGHAFELARGAAVVRLGKLKEVAKWANARACHDHLREYHPIRVEAGFEGNPGVEGGAWRPRDGDDDGLVHLRFAAGTEDLPLHVHQFSDRLLVVTSGLGLFHYFADSVTSRELRSIVVEAGDVVLFTRGVVHTFTAPISEIVLLSYHTPFLELNDPRQFTILPANARDNYRWQPAALAR